MGYRTYITILPKEHLHKIKQQTLMEDNYFIDSIYLKNKYEVQPNISNNDIQNPLHDDSSQNDEYDFFVLSTLEHIQKFIQVIANQVVKVQEECLNPTDFQIEDHLRAAYYGNYLNSNYQINMKDQINENDLQKIAPDYTPEEKQKYQLIYEKFNARRKKYYFEDITRLINFEKKQLNKSNLYEYEVFHLASLLLNTDLTTHVILGYSY